jgi:hypothetical protein
MVRQDQTLVAVQCLRASDCVLCRKLYIQLVIGLLFGTAFEFYDFAGVSSSQPIVQSTVIRLQSILRSEVYSVQTFTRAPFF